MAFLDYRPGDFKITLEVVPPAGPDSHVLLDKLKPLGHLKFDGFSVASNPVAKSRMSAMAFSHILQEETGKPAILHLTVRDHNSLGLQAELWGARALGIHTIIAVTGDPAGDNASPGARSVKGLNVFELIELADSSGMETGAVLDFRPEKNGLGIEIRRIEKKVKAGSSFIVTQPIYDLATAESIRTSLNHIKVPVIMGILPLVSARHARFLHTKVAGIAIPGKLQKEMDLAKDPVATGIVQAKQMLELARQMFSGACIMPPFDRFDILSKIL